MDGGPANGNMTDQHGCQKRMPDFHEKKGFLSGFILPYNEVLFFRIS